MSAPVEVVLVARRERFSVAMVNAILASLIFGAIGGAWLMLLLPLLTETLGTRYLAPGYWTCAALVVLARGVHNTVFVAATPLARVS